MTLPDIVMHKRATESLVSSDLTSAPDACVVSTAGKSKAITSVRVMHILCRRSRARTDAWAVGGNRDRC
jgi:hypothetical protein